MEDSNPPSSEDSLVEAALKCLCQADPWIKADYTREAVRLWRNRELNGTFPPAKSLAVPDRPARSDDKVKVVTPGSVVKRGKGGTLMSRIAIIHSLCHIESWAVDLAWDAIARFGIAYAAILPEGFYDDFVTVADDECRHFAMLEQRLQQLGSHYGALPVHDGLWESASRSANSLAARLAVEHCVHEARGLDVIPSTINRFKAAGDMETATLLEDTIYPEEINHCAAGVRWLTHLHAHAHAQGKGIPLGKGAGSPFYGESAPVSHSSRAPGSGSDSLETRGSEGRGNGASGQENEATGLEVPLAGMTVQQPPLQAACVRLDEQDAGWEAEARKHPTVQAWFHSLVRAHFTGGLKPPFNTEAREKAGFDPSWYMPLAVETNARASKNASKEAINAELNEDE